MIIPDLAVSGGSQKLALRVGIELLKKGHQVTIYTPIFDRKKCYPEITRSFPKINIVSLNRNIKSKNIAPKIFDDLLPLSVKYYLLSKKIKPSEVLIVHDEECLLSLPFLKLSSNEPDSVIWMVNTQLEKNHFQFTKRIKEHLSNIKNFRIIPYILLTLPAVVIDTFYKIQAIQYVGRFACYDTFNSSLVKKVLNRKATLVSAAADLDDYKKLRSKNIVKDKTINILSVGVMFRYRRHEDIITAVYLLNKSGIATKLSIVGRSDYDQNYFNKLKALVKKYKLIEDVTFYEFLDQKKLLSLYKDSHIFCFVNDAHTWGIAVFEAVATGMPVIITNNIGAADLIKNRESGWVVSPKKPKEIVSAVKNILNDPKQTKKIITTAKTKVLKQLSWSSFTRRLIPSV